jgi:hypothetical protein
MNEKILAYYLGALEGQDRLDVEELLLKSPAAVLDYIAIKRSFEINSEVESVERRQPSAAAVARLRREVEAKFSPRFSTTSFSMKRYWYWLPPAVAAALFVVSGGAILYSKVMEKPRDRIAVESKVNCSVDPGGLKKTTPTPMMAEAYGENSHSENSHSKDSR